MSTNRIDTIVHGTAQTTVGTSGPWVGHSGGTYTLDDVRRELFDWKMVEGSLFDVHGGIETHKTLRRSDTGALLSVVGAERKTHQYDEWLTKNVAQLLDTPDLAIQSAGLLNDGKKAWVQVGVPEDIEGPGGVKYRPFIGAYSGVDMSSTYKANTIVIACINTYAASLSEAGDKYRVRHTRNSEFRVLTAREALGIVYANGAAFDAEIAAMLAISVSDAQFGRIASRIVAPSTDSKRSVSIAERKLGELADLWANDPRVAPWRGTAFGAMQALSTHRQWVATVKNVSRSDRQIDNVISGVGDKADRSELALIREMVGA